MRSLANFLEASFDGFLTVMIPQIFARVFRTTNKRKEIPKSYSRGIFPNPKSVHCSHATNFRSIQKIKKLNENADTFRLDLEIDKFFQKDDFLAYECTDVQNFIQIFEA